MARKQTGFPKARTVPKWKSLRDRIAEMSYMHVTATTANRQLDWILSGAAANMPPAEYANRIYITTDTTPRHIYLDTGAEWVLIV